MTDKESQYNLTYLDYVICTANMLTQETLRRLNHGKIENMSTDEMAALANTLICAMTIGEKSEAWRAYAEKTKATAK